MFIGFLLIFCSLAISLNQVNIMIAKRLFKNSKSFQLEAKKTRRDSELNHPIEISAWYFIFDRLLPSIHVSRHESHI